MTEPTGQCDAILAYLQEHGSITPIDALRVCGCMRLAARIQDLEEAGHVFTVELEGENGKRWARYTLVPRVTDRALEDAGQLAMFA